MLRPYCAFLKQVYFRHQFIPMVELDTVFESLDLRAVSSVLATGNVVFLSVQTAVALQEFIATGLRQYYNFHIDVFVKDITEVQAIIQDNPFEVDRSFYNQTFICREDFAPVLLQEFQRIQPLAQEQAMLHQGKFYWCYAKATRANSEFLKVLIRNSLKHSFTLRTVGTMQKVYACMVPWVH